MGTIIIIISAVVFAWKFPVTVQNWFASNESSDSVSEMGTEDTADAVLVPSETNELETIMTVENTHGEEMSAETAAGDSVQAVAESEESMMLGENEVTETTMTTNNEPMTNETATMLVAGGCFWCVEADLEKLPGVIEVVSGYAGGSTDNPTYQTYKEGGHREVVEISYDPTQVSFEEILIYAMKHIDPTDDDGSFYDRGDGYSPAFYYENVEEKQIIDALISEVNDNGPYDSPLAIDVESRPTFWPAEDFHQDYYKGTLSSLKYKAYRTASGRDRFIEENWGDDTGADLPWRNEEIDRGAVQGFWSDYMKPSDNELKATLDDLAYKVTQKDGTERAGTSPLDKNYDRGIYVDILSGEPLFSSRDKFDSGTGWPSFVKPIIPEAVTEHEDRKLFAVRTEIRSAIADNHLGHVFADGPVDRGGLRYCMNGVALRFVPEAEMEAAGYGTFLEYL